MCGQTQDKPTYRAPGHGHARLHCDNSLMPRSVKGTKMWLMTIQPSPFPSVYSSPPQASQASRAWQHLDLLVNRDGIKVTKGRLGYGRGFITKAKHSLTLQKLLEKGLWQCQPSALSPGARMEIRTSWRQGKTGLVVGRERNPTANCKAPHRKAPHRKAPHRKAPHRKALTAKPLTAKSLTAKPLTAKPLTAKPLTAKPLTAKPLTRDEIIVQSLGTGHDRKTLNCLRRRTGRSKADHLVRWSFKTGPTACDCGDANYGHCLVCPSITQPSAQTTSHCPSAPLLPNPQLRPPRTAPLPLYYPTLSSDHLALPLCPSITQPSAQTTSHCPSAPLLPNPQLRPPRSVKRAFNLLHFTHFNIY
ncbi:hypothetical protein NHX12_020328 [Muraenolepis orangiensis]|uniref:Uncharacterized protein n=1 Tax=Muraenolepis orangiensis TaxID=630683 RepID=A0A9Q0ERN7_9TELE|nr:hypothetical protein NHX12_020328 [Muraenolepis orangiensis]